jgi:hypothetical protein
VLLAWHLLMPPVAYNRETGQFVSVRDLPLAQWYHVGEFATLAACHIGRAEMIREQQA